MRIIFVSGASGVGKTTFCRKISDTLNSLNISTRHINLDTYIVPHSKRDIPHGYSKKTYNMDELFIDLDDYIFFKRTIYGRKYDHKKGTLSEKNIKICPADFVFIEGAISLIEEITERYPAFVRIFIDSDDTNLIELKKNLLMQTRGYSKNKAKECSEEYMKGYLKFCKPTKRFATHILLLKNLRREYSFQKLNFLFRNSKTHLCDFCKAKISKTSFFGFFVCLDCKKSLDKSLDKHYVLRREHMVKSNV